MNTIIKLLTILLMSLVSVLLGIGIVYAYLMLMFATMFI